MTDGARRRPDGSPRGAGSVTENDPHRSAVAQFLRTLVKVVLAAAGLAFVALVGLSILIANSFRECNASPWIQGVASTMSTVTLDAAHPVAEQTVTVQIPALALPEDVIADAILLKVEPEVIAPASPSPSSGSTTPRPSGSADPGADLVDVAFIGLDPGTTAGRIVPAIDEPVLAESPSARTALLDCPPGVACERMYRVIVSLAEAPGARAVELRWQPSVLIQASSFGGCPDTVPSRPSVEATTPTAAGVQLASAHLAPMAASGTVIANHLRLETQAAGDAAWVRLEVDTEPAGWLPWVRVTDDAGRMLVDGPLGRPWTPQERSLIEVPAFTRCTEGAACSDGLWVVVQAIPSDVPPFEPRWTPLAPPARFNWAASVSTMGRAGATPPVPRIAIDATAPDPGATPAVVIAAPTVPLADGVTRSVEASIHVPAQAAEATDPDWRLGAFAVASWYGHGIRVAAWVEGAGASSIRGGASGDGTANLVAHPFDECPPSSPCDVTLHLVSRFSADPRSSVGGEPKSVWSLSLLGVPANSTVTFGDPVDEREEGSVPGNLIPGLAVLAVGVLVVILLARRSRAS